MSAMAQRGQELSTSVFSTAVFSTVTLATCLAATAARAGDAPAPLREDARCQSFGDGFLAVPGSDACVRFSGYVAAGAGFNAGSRGAPGSLQAPVAPIMGTDAGAAFETQTDTPMGPVHTYVEVGRPRFAP
jgi:hypothetical protein